MTEKVQRSSSVTPGEGTGGIEFFKQTFKWILEFGSVVSDLDNSEDEDEEINFNTIMDNNANDTEYYRSSSNVYDNISNEADTSSEEDLHSENDINSNSDIEVVNKEHHLSEEENDMIDNEVQDRVNDNSDEQHIKEACIFHFLYLVNFYEK